jgi:chaperonin GroEL
MILNGEEVKQKLLQGINLVADTVKPTLGPQAKTVILQGNPPVVINDGVTITKYVSHNDPYVQMGVQLVQNLASKAQEGSGDGTTTACILAQAFCNELMKNEEQLTTHNFNLLMESLREQTINFLNSISIEVKDDDIMNVATIAANNDSSLGELIQEAFNTVGRDGVITVEESNNYQTQLILREGMEIQEGYLSHLMCNTESGKVEFDNPVVFMSNMSLRHFKDIMPLLEYSASQSRPLLIMCKGMDGSALNNLIMNLINKTVECAVVMAPNFGDAQIDELSDIQSLIGGKVFVEESKDDSKLFTETDLGTCSKVIITKETTTFVGGEGNTEERIKSLKQQAQELKGHDLARIKTRVSRLKGGIATIKVGASSSIEMREKKERLDDALNATKAALEEGIVVGGGVPFIRLAYAIEAPEWFRKSVVKPYRVLLDNANYTEQTRVVGFEIEKTIDGTNPNWGFNAVSCQHEDLAEAGVFDPVKVSKNSFLAALSIAQLFYSTDVAVLVEE